ncbi:HAD family hydrolase [Streptomyces xiamenensis]
MTASRFPYQLIATDLDGTLLRGDQTISERTRAALAAAGTAGAAHIVATGRTVAWTRHILDDLGYTGLAVCGQGGQLYHAGEDRLLTSVTLDRAVARRALEALEERVGPVVVAASLDGLDGGIAMGPGFAWRQNPEAVPHPNAPDLSRPVADREGLWAAPISKLYLRHPELSDDQLAAAGTEVAGAYAAFVVSGEDLVEMLPLGLTKATGLSLAARRLGATAAGTIAFGDMPNDIPMLSWAAHGVAMAGAHPHLLAVADEVTASNNAEGIAKVLERLLLG